MNIGSQNAILIMASHLSGNMSQIDLPDAKTTLELVEKKAAKLVEQNEMEKKLINTIDILINDDSRRKKIGANAGKLHKSNSLDLIVDTIRECVYV